MAITKSNWLAGQQCQTMSWMQMRSEASAPGEAVLFRMEQGREIGEHARSQFPNGVLVTRRGSATAVEVTQTLLQDPSTAALFEAAFAVGPFAAKADILVRCGDGWHLLEVKSSFVDTTSISDIVADIAYTAMVLRRAGVRLNKASLMLISREYRHGMAFDRLFGIIDKTAEVETQIAENEETADAIAAALGADVRPTAALISACRSCDFFTEHCVGSGHAHTVLELPNLHYKKLQKLSAAGVVGLSQLPDDFELTDRQQRVKDSVVNGAMFVDPELRTALGAIQWPCHYLDFETLATVMPPYEGYGCHHQVMTQFSIHHRDAPDTAPRQSEFLADASHSDERGLALSLIDRLAGPGSIIVYGAFEKTRVTALQKTFPDLSEQLQGLIDRLVNLNLIVTNHVYHPDFRGSTSIKNVLPVLVPELSYDGLAVRDGDTAITRFARMARGEVSGDAASATRNQLLEYCRLDTLAMVQLHEKLLKLAN